MTPTWAIRWDFAAALVEHEDRRRRVAEILTRPCFRELEELSLLRDRRIEEGPVDAQRIAAILGDRANEGAAFATKRGRDGVATGEIRNGTRETDEGVIRFASHLVFPHDGSDAEAVVTAVCELADTLDARAGFVTVEPGFEAARRLAVGGHDPRPRAGLSRQRIAERMARDRYDSRWHELLSGPEWGTFLGAPHLAKLDLQKLRASGVFDRIVEIVPERLVFLQVTADAADDLRDDFEAKLLAARRVLRPILIDLGSVTLG